MNFLRKDRGAVLKGAVVLVTGNAIAQAIPFLAMPVLTRLFDAHAFALYALLFSAAGLLGGVSALRFDVAVSVAKTREDASVLWFVALYVIAAVVLLLVSAAICVPELLRRAGLDALGSAWYLVPTVGFGMAFTQLNSYWMLRAGALNGVSLVKLAQAVVFVASSLILGWQGAPLGGMMTAFCLAVLVCSIFSFTLSQRVGFPAGRPTWKRCISVVRQFRDFPVLGALPAILDAVSLLLPLFAISTRFSVVDAGQFALVRQAVAAPLSLISAGVGQVLLRHVSDLHHRGGSVGTAIRSAGIALAAIAIPSALFLGFLGPSAFSLVFGAKWGGAGHLASVLAIPFCLRFVVSGLSTTLPALRRLGWVAIWQGAYFASIVGLVALPGLDFDRFIFGYAIVETMLYLIYAGLIARSVQMVGEEQRA
ncbi:hypothetical protein PEP31012_03110 [Pandoraea eparura]|uniref:Polysaccharide biosynthesis protein n=1 Tax=Pandoraea eparura TaxID=2508291 RepID=A0A5E4WAA1_9BURK|nr:oligosaccharide flippase family protein [Pandoraea eparura]VVE20210.1 hypothetical protein PEP31012_03110 [Pandoraea eparura]